MRVLHLLKAVVQMVRYPNGHISLPFFRSIIQSNWIYWSLICHVHCMWKIWVWNGHMHSGLQSKLVPPSSEASTDRHQCRYPVFWMTLMMTDAATSWPQMLTHVTVIGTQMLEGLWQWLVIWCILQCSPVYVPILAQSSVPIFKTGLNTCEQFRFRVSVSYICIYIWKYLNINFICNGISCFRIKSICI